MRYNGIQEESVDVLFIDIPDVVPSQKVSRVSFLFLALLQCKLQALAPTKKGTNSVFCTIFISLSVRAYVRVPCLRQKVMKLIPRLRQKTLKTIPYLAARHR